MIDSLHAIRVGGVVRYHKFSKINHMVVNASAKHPHLGHESQIKKTLALPIKRGFCSNSQNQKK